VYFLIATRQGKRFADRLRNEIELCDRYLFRIVLAGIAAFGGLALRDECDPVPVGRPLRLSVVAGLRELGQGRSALTIVAVKPEVSSKIVLLPISPLGVNHNRVSVRGNRYRKDVDVVEKVVKRELGFVGSTSVVEHEYGKKRDEQKRSVYHGSKQRYIASTQHL
jgi:hypothetical protein